MGADVILIAAVICALLGAFLFGAAAASWWLQPDVDELARRDRIR